MANAESLIDALGGDPGYVKFLLVERPYIRSALLNRSPLLDEEDRVSSYPSSVGSAMHNDIIELDLWLSSLPVQDQKLLLDWAENNEGRQVYGAAKMRRVGKLLKKYGEQRVTPSPTV